MAASTYLLSRAQLDQALLSQKQLDAISKQVLIAAQEAIKWFETARRVDQLADTAFSFTLVRVYDARVMCKDGEATSSFGWFKRETVIFKISTGGGPAYDQRIDSLGMRAMLEASAPSFPRQPTASLPVEQIITADELTKKLLAYLRRPVPQKVIEITLSVQLFDLNKNCFATNNWIMMPKRTSSY